MRYLPDLDYTSPIGLVHAMTSPSPENRLAAVADEPAVGWRHGKTIPVDPAAIGGMVNIDLDDDGRLIGIEVMDRATALSDKILAALDRA